MHLQNNLEIKERSGTKLEDQVVIKPGMQFDLDSLTVVDQLLQQQYIFNGQLTMTCNVKEVFNKALIKKLFLKVLDRGQRKCEHRNINGDFLQHIISASQTLEKYINIAKDILSLVWQSYAPLKSKKNVIT